MSNIFALPKIYKSTLIPYVIKEQQREYTNLTEPSDLKLELMGAQYISTFEILTLCF